MLDNTAFPRKTRIQRSQGWSPVNWRELWEYRDLLAILAMRDVKVRYKQTALGVAWVVLQPLFTALIFAVIFGRLANLPSDGQPYLLFAYAGILPWSLFAQSLHRAGGSLIADARLISKVYFPRMIVPAASVLAVLVDFAVALAVMLALAAYYHVPLGWQLLLMPVFLGSGIIASVGVGLWISALNVQYRDFLYALPFLVQAWMYLSPVAYSSSLIPNQWWALYALNPMVGVIEGFRWSLLGSGVFSMTLFLPSLLVALMSLVSGAMVFRRVERVFADVI